MTYGSDAPHSNWCAGEFANYIHNMGYEVFLNSAFVQIT